MAWFICEGQATQVLIDRFVILGDRICHFEDCTLGVFPLLYLLAINHGTDFSHSIILHVWVIWRYRLLKAVLIQAFVVKFSIHSKTTALLKLNLVNFKSWTLNDSLCEGALINKPILTRRVLYSDNCAFLAFFVDNLVGGRCRRLFFVWASTKHRPVKVHIIACQHAAFIVIYYFKALSCTETRVLLKYNSI